MRGDLNIQHIDPEHPDWQAYWRAIYVLAEEARRQRETERAGEAR